MNVSDRLKAFFSSKGRANRREFWTWIGVAVAAFAVAVGLATLFGDNGVYDEPDVPRPLRLTLVIAGFVPMLLVAIKMRAVWRRRRNDADVSDGFRTALSMPILGRYLGLFTLGFVPSMKGHNEHGPGPGTSAIVDTFGDPTAR